MILCDGMEYPFRNLESFIQKDISGGTTYFHAPFMFYHTGSDFNVGILFWHRYHIEFYMRTSDYMMDCIHGDF